MRKGLLILVVAVLSLVIGAQNLVSPTNADAGPGDSLPDAPHLAPPRGGPGKPAVVNLTATLPMTFHGGVVQHTTTTFTIFWGPPASFAASYISLINRYFTDINATAYYGMNTQYTDNVGGPNTPMSNSSAFGGTWTDTTAYPGGRGGAGSPLTDADIRAEVDAASVANPAWHVPGVDASGNGFVYFVYTPSGVVECSSFPTSCSFGVTGGTFAFCAYHWWYSNVPPAKIYAYEPYDEDAGLGCRGFSTSPNGNLAADAEISSSSHEHFEAATDPYGTGWFETNTSGEDGDKCAYKYSYLDAAGAHGIVGIDGSNIHLGANKYIIQLEWSNQDFSGIAYSGCTARLLAGLDANIQITPANATNPLNGTHTLTGHVNINTGSGFVNAPALTLITFAKQSGPGSFVGNVNTCSTVGATGSCTVQISSPTVGTTVIRATTTVTVADVPFTRATSDGLTGDSADAQKTWVDANIQVTPATATNPVNATHTLTGHVNVDPGTGATNAPALTLITFTKASGPGSFVGNVNTCTTVGITGSCTVQLSSPTPGLTVVHATTTVTVAGVPVTRATGDGLAGDSADAQKTWVDANIQITPASETNPVNAVRTFTITVNAINGTLGAGTATASIASGPGSFVGPPTCNYAGGAANTCTIQITSALVGTTVISATSNISVTPANTIAAIVARTTGAADNAAAGGSGTASETWITAAQAAAALAVQIAASAAGPTTKVLDAAMLMLIQQYLNLPGGFGRPGACLLLGQLRVNTANSADPAVILARTGPTGWLAQIDAIKAAVPCP